VADHMLNIPAQVDGERMNHQLATKEKKPGFGSPLVKMSEG